jgi:HD-GYP domain-containing protein (c-di-GMP phosphodiesterase class II)
LAKTDHLTLAEQKILQRHTILGRRLSERVRGLSLTVLDMIEYHHEWLDGSGYPYQFPAERLSLPVRIVSIANLYDNLCNPPNPTAALTPKTALAIMYTRYKNKLDSQLLEHFIRRIGVYPPGTIVRLNDGSIGLVIAVDPKALLKPELLLYNPDIPKEQAMIVNLQEYENLCIKDVLTPKDYPPRIYQYLGLQERLGYFIEKRPEG